MSLPLVRLHRYHPAIYAVPLLVAALTIYYINQSPEIRETPPNPAPGLHRSNARRRRRSRPTSPLPSRVELGFLDDHASDIEVLGYHTFRWSHGEDLNTPLCRSALSVFDSLLDVSSSAEIRDCRSQIQDACLSLYIYKHLMHQSLDRVQLDRIVTSLEGNGYAADRIRHFLTLNQRGELKDYICAWISNELSRGRDLERIVSDEALRASCRRSRYDSQDNAVTDIDSASDVSWRAEDNAEEDQQESKNLLALLYAMAQDKNRREGFVHRGITCNCCGTHPIKGIRYRCTSCNDFDMCEICEGQGYHTPTHLLYKIRIPRSHLGSQAQPVLYPGKYSRYSRPMTTSIVEGLVKSTGFTEAEIEGYWEQFRCLASVEWSEDPFKYGLAIDRRTFEQLLYPSNSARPSAPNLVYDRIFSFYDSNDDDLIGFYEFIEGLSNLRKKGPKEKWKRIFRCFDIDRDGYVNRRDFLRMFRAHYAITREMTAEIVANMEEESSDDDLREMITSGQPISASFTSQSPGGQPSRNGLGKSTDAFGDVVTVDHKGVLSDGKETADMEEIVAQRAEHQYFGNVDQDHVSFKTIDIRDKIKSLQQEPWPSEHISILDVKTALGERREIDQIRDHNEQIAIRRVAQQRLAWDWQRRHYVRLQAIKTRRKRQQLIADVSSASIDHISLGQVPTKSFSEMSSPQGGFLSTYNPRTTKILRRLQDEVDELVNESSLDFGSERFQDVLFMLFAVGFSISETVDNLKGFTQDDDDLQRFVTTLFDLLKKNAPYANFDASDAAEPHREAHPQLSAFVEPDQSTTAKSSLKQSEQDERPCRSDEPQQDEEDVGQEILFQLTQEALNELIDPFLKPREDLWLEAQTTKAKRKTYSEAICKAVDDPIIIFQRLNSFLKHIQITPNYSGRPEHWAQALRSEAANFREFLYFSLLEEEDPHSHISQVCPKCRSRVETGMFCKQCGTASAVAQKLFMYPSTTEICGFCHSNGVTRRFKNEYSDCDECLSPSTRKAKDAQWLWEVLSGDKTRAEREQTRRRNEMLERRRLHAEHSQQIPNSDEQSTGKTVAPNHLDDYEIANNSNENVAISSPSLSNGDRSPSAAESVHPATPETGSHDLPVPDIAEHETRDDEQRAAFVTTLEQTISMFDNKDTSQETKISQKSLQELLHETGFSVKSEGENPYEEDPSHHPPRSSSLPDTSYSYPASEAHLYADPTLPQNRPNLAPQVPGCPSNKPASLEPPDAATLRYWAALTILEADDEQVRGGPGRLSEQEFLDIMLGECGKGLEFVGDWMNLTAF